MMLHCQIYHSSVAHGPHHLKTVGGYFHLGNVFLSENKPDVTLSLHDQVKYKIDEYLCFNSSNLGDSGVEFISS